MNESFYTYVHVAAPKPPCFLHLYTCGSPKATLLPPLMYMWQPQSRPASSTYVHVTAPKPPCFLHLCTCGSPKAALLPPLMYMWQPQSRPASSTYVPQSHPASSAYDGATQKALSPSLLSSTRVSLKVHSPQYAGMNACTCIYKYNYIAI